MIIGKKEKKPVMVSKHWEAQYRVEHGEAEYVKYLGNGEEYEVPGEIEGCPVVKIAPYAFAEHRNLFSVTLPFSVRVIGAHAFYNCRMLKSLGFCDNLEEIEDGAFKNCQSLSHLILTTNPHRKLVLKNILMDTTEGILVTIYFLDGAKKERAELIFPPYLVEYAENTPARILEKQAYGSGERYRHCLYAGQLNFEQYDQLFDYSIAVDDMEYPVQCAVNRLRYPYCLKDESKERYRAFLCAQMKRVLYYYIKKEDVDTITWMLDEKLLSKEDMNEAAQLCRRYNKNAILPMLVEYQNVNFKPQKKSFSL